MKMRAELVQRFKVYGPDLILEYGFVNGFEFDLTLF